MRFAHLAMPAVAAGLLLVAAVLPPAGRWTGVTDMAHGELPLLFELRQQGEAWSGRAILGSDDLAGDGVAVDSLWVRGDSVGFSFGFETPRGSLRVGITGHTAADSATGTIRMFSQGLAVDRGTWRARRVR